MLVYERCISRLDAAARAGAGADGRADAIPLGLIGGPITGIAIDPAAGILGASSTPSIVVGVAPVPVVVPTLSPAFLPPGSVGGLAIGSL